MYGHLNPILDGTTHAAIITYHCLTCCSYVRVQARTDAFAALEEAMQRHDIAASVPTNLDRLVTVFLENISAFSSMAHPRAIPNI